VKDEKRVDGEEKELRRQRRLNIIYALAQPAAPSITRGYQ